MGDTSILTSIFVSINFFCILQLFKRTKFVFEKEYFLFAYRILLASSFHISHRTFVDRTFPGLSWLSHRRLYTSSCACPSRASCTAYWPTRFHMLSPISPESARCHMLRIFAFSFTIDRFDWHKTRTTVRRAFNNFLIQSYVSKTHPCNRLMHLCSFTVRAYKRINYHRMILSMTILWRQESFSWDIPQ